MTALISKCTLFSSLALHTTQNDMHSVEYVCNINVASIIVRNKDESHKDELLLRNQYDLGLYLLLM